jgi:hypothetical protein
MLKEFKIYCAVHKGSVSTIKYQKTVPIMLKNKQTES